MENNTATPVQSLCETAENYGKTSLELLKLNAVNRSADFGSSLVSQLAIALVVVLLIFTLNIGLSLWVGEFLGKTYYGFFVVAAAYALLALVLHIFSEQLLKEPLSNSIIRKMLK